MIKEVVNLKERIMLYHPPSILWLKVPRDFPEYHRAGCLFSYIITSSFFSPLSMFGDFLVDMIHTLPPPIQWFIDCQLWSISPPAVLWPHLLFCRPHLHHTLMSCNATNVIKYFPQFKILRSTRGNNFRQTCYVAHIDQI